MTGRPLRSLFWLSSIPCTLLAIGQPVAQTRVDGGEGAQGTRTVRDPVGFRRGLLDIHKLMARGLWPSARRDLLSLLRRHRGHRYVFVRKADLLEDFRRSAFYLKHKSIDAAASVSGRLLQHDSRSGRVEVAYTPKNLQDFDEPEAKRGSQRKLAWHPMQFRGPYTIEVRGQNYKETVHPLGGAREVRLGFNLHVCGGESGHVEVAFGNRQGPSGKSAARVVSWQSGAKRNTLVSIPSPARIGEEFSVRVEVMKTRIRAVYNGKELFQVKRDGREWGRFAIEGRNFDSLVVSGRVDPAWIRDRIDHHTQMLLFDFDRTYEGDAVPTWLAEGAIPNKHSFNPAQAWPADAENKHLPVLRDMAWFFERADFEGGLDYLDGLRDILPANTQSYLRARFFYELDEIDKAAMHCEKLVRADPTFITGRQLRAELWVRRGQGEEAAIRDYRAMIADHPKARELYVDLVVLMIQAGRANEAATVLQSAISATGNHSELHTLQRMLKSVTQGPAWRKTFEHRSTNYLVRSNIDKALCVQAARVLEDAHKDYVRALGRPRQPKEPYRVFLFAGRAGYERFCSDILGERDTHTAGLYSAMLKQLLIWNLPQRERMLRTIRHEGFHQYLDSLYHDAPAWLNEGLAEYFEHTHKRADHLRTLTEREILPVAKFVRMPWKAFYRGSGRNYAQAWALVHFLRHGPKQYLGVLERMFRALAAGKSPKAAVREAFDTVDPTALQRAFDQYLDTLRR